MKKIITSLMVGCFILTNAALALAANNSVPPFEGQQETIGNHLAILSGGVGLSERQQMDQMAKGYNLKLIFDVPNGDYLSNVMVTIQNPQGHVLFHNVAEGPWFYAKLPAGTYTVKAYFDGHTIVRKVKVDHETRDVIMTWSV
ncbi:MAG: hypothetical protein M0036_16565 [Desulfobacteraceae bacterium]|nr:hypothetical protein [Desulfobacteraceae bacterium]